MATRDQSSRKYYGPTNDQASRELPNRQSATPGPDLHYTVLIRLPFPRNGFVDPPSVDWDTSKDDALWQILSRTSNGRDIHWKELAQDFGVPLPFLFQQVAWLYERQLSQVRAQMRRVGNQAPTAPIAGHPDGATAGSRASMVQQEKRIGSGGPSSRVPSSLSVRPRESPALRGDSSQPNTPTRAQAPPMSRTSSTSTAVQSRHAGFPSSRRPSLFSRPSANIVPARAVPEQSSKSLEDSKSVEHHLEEGKEEKEEPELDDSSPSNSSDEDDDTVNKGHLRSQVWRRPIHRSTRRVTPGSFRPPSGEDEDADDDDDDDEESPAFLPFSNRPAKPDSQDPSATLRDRPTRPMPRHARQLLNQSSSVKGARDVQASTSSASSASSHAAGATGEASQRRQGPTGPLSPRRTAELAGKSSRRKNGKEGSDGTPSMGSSFSDLDGRP
ncbi:MAG: hypothetical protein M4579_006876 [Chaenotheca gracillima]|nr:MAG: hypothetical protein M4579_006876 [Chaenotheca gracillima]